MGTKSSNPSVRLRLALVLVAAALAAATPTALGSLGNSAPVAGGGRNGPCCGDGGGPKPATPTNARKPLEGFPCCPGLRACLSRTIGVACVEAKGRVV